jgi:DNA-directed primase/polymerase protein
MVKADLPSTLGDGFLTFSQFQQLLPFPELIRCFYLQRQLFDFLDSQSIDSSNDGSSDEGNDDWIPLSAEFDSEAKVLSKRHASGQTLNAMINSGPSIFRRIRPESERLSSGAGDATTPIVSLGVLGGATRASEQERYFIAVRKSFVYALHQRLSPQQQHLYEILREGVPCHLYLDVEQDYEFCATDEYRERSSHLIPSSPGSGSASPQPLPDSFIAPTFCRWDCPHVPEHSQTTEVLLRTLEMYLSSRHDLHGISLRDADVVVLRSVPIGELKRTPPKKFSQHYVIRFRNHIFRDNRHVGALVKEYVDWLCDVSSRDSEVHESLFFHGDPQGHPYTRRLLQNSIVDGTVISIPVFDNTSAPSPGNDTHVPPRSGQATSPLLPKRCIVDTAVYTRNRMFRCWGSTKLGKSLVLALDPYCSGLQSSALATIAPTDEAFFQSLISMARPAQGVTFIDLFHASDDGTHRTVSHHRSPCVSHHSRGSRSDLHLLPSPFPAIDELARGAASVLPPTVPSHQRQASSQHENCQRVIQFSIVYDIDGITPAAIFYPVLHTKFCSHIGREHKSNGVYFVANLSSRQLSLKCHDPDCRFRATDVVAMIPASAIPSPATSTHPLMERGSSPSENRCQPSSVEPADPFYVVDNTNSMKYAASIRTRLSLKRTRSDDCEDVANK